MRGLVSADGPVVGILVGSESDRERMQAAIDELEQRGLAHEFEVRSAHRQPDAVAEYARSARDRGLRVLICGAGLAAALPGVVAAHTDLPVIGVPLRSSKSVLDVRAAGRARSHPYPPPTQRGEEHGWADRVACE